MTNSFCRTFGIDHPVVLAPMAGIVTPELVAAVSNAGGLGLAPLWLAEADALKDGVRAIRALTDRPFGVNLNMDFRDEAQFEACLEEGVDVLSLFWGETGDFVPRAKAAGVKVILTVSNARAARAAAALEPDAICAQGWEAGGHVEGTVTTMALVPRVVDAVGRIPVIAAGGIADGRGLVAALALGAQAAWIGTRFLAAEEASIHPEYRARILAASETDTGHYDDLYDINWPDAPHRALKNSTSAMWEAAGKPPLGQRPDEGAVLARSRGKDVVRYQSISPGAHVDGAVEALSLWSGQGVGLVTRVQPAGEIMAEILQDARQVAARLGPAKL